MSKEPEPAELLRQQAKAERRLLRTEQRAERDLLDAQERLASAQITLDKAQARVGRRLKRVTSALELLQAAQSARSVGPNGSSNEEPVAPLSTPEPEPVIVQPERDDSVLPPPTAKASTSDDEEPSDPRPTRRRKPRATAPAEPTS